MAKKEYEDNIKRLNSKGHFGYVSSVTFSPDGQYFISGSEDKSIKLWDIKRGQELRSFEGHNSCINFLAITPDYKYIISGSDDGTVKKWDMSTGDELGVFTVKGYGHLAGLSLGGKNLLTRRYNRNITVHEIEPESFNVKLIKEFDGFEEFDNSIKYTHPFQNMAISSNGQYISLSKHILDEDRPYHDYSNNGYLNNVDDVTIILLDVKSGGKSKEFKGHHYSVSDMVVTSNGKYIISADQNNTINLWDTKKGQIIKIFSGYTDLIAITPDEKSLLLRNDDSTLNLVDIENSHVIKSFHNLDDIRVISSAFTQNGRYLILGMMDHTIRLLDVESGLEIKSFGTPYPA